MAFAGSLYLDCIDCGVTSLDFCFGFWGGTDVGYFQQQNKTSGLFVRLNLGSFYYTTYISRYTSLYLSWTTFLSIFMKAVTVTVFFGCSKKHMKGQHVYEGERLASSFQEQSSNGCLISSSADGRR